MLSFGAEVIFQLAAARKSLTATFIARVLTAMAERPIGVLNLDTGAKRMFYLIRHSRNCRLMVLDALTLRPKLLFMIVI